MRGPLIIGVEQADGGADALALGAELARIFEAQPLIATAVALPEGVLSMPELTAALKATAAGTLSDPLEQLADLNPIGEAVAGSSAARALHELAERRSAIGVIVGPTDRGKLGRLVPGSTAERLLHGAPCAVGVAAAGHAERGALKRIGVAFDGVAEGMAALRVGAAIAKRTHSELTILTVVEPVEFPFTPGVAGTISLSETQAREESRMRRIMDGGVGRVPTGVQAEGRLLRGLAGPSLVDVSSDYDLMVVGSRSYGPLRRTLLGSTSRRLFAAGSCSVLALPRGVAPSALVERPRGHESEASLQTEPA